MQVVEKKTSPCLSHRLPSAHPHDAQLGVTLPVGTSHPEPRLGYGRGEAQLRAAVRGRFTMAAAAQAPTAEQSWLAIREPQVHLLSKEKQEGPSLRDRCQAEGEHKSSSVQKLDSQPVEEVLEPNSTPGDLHTPAYHPQSPCNLPSRVGNGCPEGSTASVAAPATRRSSI